MSDSNSTASDIGRWQDAAEWVQNLPSSTDPALAEQWMEWCSSDPLNLPAFERMQELWDGFDGASGATFRAPSPAQRFGGRGRLMGLAASVLLLLATTAWFALRYERSEAFTSAVGERHSAILFDGSRFELAPDSRISVRFTPMRRDVQLERGQAFFAVAHNAMRPFIVHAGGLTVTSRGTEFDVRIDASSTVVTVSEGRVSVTSNASQRGGVANSVTETVRAREGQRVIFSSAEQRLKVAAVDPRTAELWRDGILPFVSEPLESVVGAVNLYSARKIFVASALRQMRFTGTVSSANLADWLDALPQIFSVDVVDQGANGIHILSRTDHGILK
ncbi:MAG: FecR domain-containing protein [Steroidobacteraceae bacterium]